VPTAPPARIAAPAIAEPVPGTAQAPVELISWREDLQVTASPQERTVGKVRVRKYVKVEDFTGTIPIEYETVQVIREPVSAQEAALLTPTDIAELTQEVELHTQEAVVTRRMVPIERVRLQISRVKGEATISDTLRSEHFEVEEPIMPPNLQEAVRRVDAPYDGRIDHNPQGAQGSQGTQSDQGNHSENGKRRFGRRGH
jgi:stress response protein YsnF